MKKNIYVGLFLVALATLSFEILLTRIFSVTMWYHFAFVAISVALFGMTVGAIVVYAFPAYFSEDKAKRRLASSALFFSWSILLSFLTQLCIPFAPKEINLNSLYSIALTYLVLSAPFVLSGICMCVALTQFPKHVGKLYAADLLGAAAGCIFLVGILNFTDGPTAVVVIAAVAALASLSFAWDGSKRVRKAALITALVLTAFSIVNSVASAKQSPLLRLVWVRGSYEAKPLYEKWNSFSRVTVSGDESTPVKPAFWGASPAYAWREKIKQLEILIDAGAGTVLTAFNGNLKELEYLKYDIINFAHYLRPDSKVLVIGTGGGRDILSALVFRQKSVLGVEINSDIIGMLNKRFGDFTGHLDKLSNVRFVNDEARSYIARTRETFDIIQVSLIDTAAATAAGAFVLTENSLYTVEAWKIFLGHLTPDGVLTFSRWYYRDVPGEMYKLTSLASYSLAQIGIQDPRAHLVIVRHRSEGEGLGGVGTMLVSKRPFTGRDIDLVEKTAADLRFEVMLSPRFAADKNFEALASGRDLLKFTSEFPVNIAPSFDDSPFFFHMLRFRNFFDWQKLGVGEHNAKAIFVLMALLFTVTVLCILCILVPLRLTAKPAALKDSAPFFVLFIAIGLGFMFIEISQMQRLIVFLGHPIYGLAVVLFSLLLSSGLGSYFTQRIGDARLGRASLVYVSVLVAVLCVFGASTTRILGQFEAAPTPLRALLSVAILFVLGFFMGMPFPIGMRMASKRSPAITPWLWGVNGATSVLASVLAVVISISQGITAAFWTGFFCYLAAFFVFLRLARNGRSAS